MYLGTLIYLLIILIILLTILPLKIIYSFTDSNLSRLELVFKFLIDKMSNKEGL